jgi:hypothetical protein
LQPETHETLYRSLADITVRVKAALCEDDAEMLMGLAGEHREVMDKLDRAGLSQDIGLFDLIKETRDQVYEILAEIGNQRDELGRQLVMFGKKKRLSAAYARNMVLQYNRM